MHLPPGRKRRCSTTWQSRRHDKGLTLIEMMVVVAVTLIFMLALTQVFSILGDSVNSGRSMIELNGHIRSMSKRIQHDLDGVTVPLDPPINLSRGEGYFEYVEGPASDKNSNANPTRLSQTDTRLGDWDDVLMFTTRSEGAPFVGQGPGGPIESQVAEIIYWMSAVDLNADGNFQPNEWNLYRRVLLVLPDIENQLSALSTAPDLDSAEPLALDFFANYDISARFDLEARRMVANSLADLTKRENRSSRWDNSNIDDEQPPLPPLIFPFPLQHGPGPDGASGNEDDTPRWLLPLTGDRQGDDLLVSGVLAFDVRAFDHLAAIRSVNGQTLVPSDPGWDPNGGTLLATGAYVDLNYAAALDHSIFSGPFFNELYQFDFDDLHWPVFSTYDTWSFHYEHDGLDNNDNGLIDEGVDGFDNNEDGSVDDLMERETSPPYAVPLRGIQVQVRLYEPSSQAVKQATITANFVE